MRRSEIEQWETFESTLGRMSRNAQAVVEHFPTLEERQRARFSRKEAREMARRLEELALEMRRHAEESIKAENPGGESAGVPKP